MPVVAFGNRTQVMRGGTAFDNGETLGVPAVHLHEVVTQCNDRERAILASA